MPSPIIPRKVLFGNPEREMVTVSRDGSRIAYLAPLEGVLNVWVAPIDAVQDAAPVTRDSHRGIRFYFWAHNTDFIIYAQDRDGDENWRVYAVDLRGGETRDLTPYDSVHAVPQPPSPRFPNEILIGINDRDPQLHDIHRVDILSGETSLVTRNDIGASDFVADFDYNVRLARVSLPEGGSRLLAPSESGEWETLFEIASEDDLTTFPLGFDADGRRLYMQDSRAHDTSALVEVDFDTGAQRELARDPKADAAAYMLHPVTHRPQAVAFEYDRVRWQVLDESIAEHLHRIESHSEGRFSVTSCSMDGRIWIVEYERDDGPKTFYLYDSQTAVFSYLFSNRPDLEDAPLAPMRSHVVRARDGLDLVIYCTLPMDSAEDGGDRPSQPLPAVLLVHGGPWGRDSWGYDPHHQLLANRGYAVISVNFRGSTGFGKRFVNAANMEWGGRMHEDLIDVVEWAVAERIADADRVAIMGGSYGGYAALVGITFTPELFACAVDIVGPSNLLTLLDSVPPYWKPMISMLRARVGDDTTEEGRRLLRERSPLTRVDSIVRPLLIGQGANDPRVKRAESDQIAQAMSERGIPVAYALYPDEGHGFARPENTLSFIAIAEAFLARWLGGRSEPIGSDFDGSSIQILAGADQIPGLSESLRDEPTES